MRITLKITALFIMVSLPDMLFIETNAKRPLKGLTPDTEKQTYDAIIVPGVPYNDEYWSRVLLGRIYWSLYLYNNGTTRNIIYSGSAVYTPYVEAKIMAMYAKKLGIPEENIFTETNAEHSVENVFNSYQIAKKLGFKKVALATDPFQSRMMKWASKRMDVHIDFIPFSFDVLDTMQIKDVDIDAQKAYVEDFTSLDERENFFQRLKGTIGGNIDFKN